MRKLFGFVVLIVGIGGLGWLATTTHAERIQNAISQSADAIARNSEHAIQTEVAGRDLRVRGTVGDVDDYAAALLAFEAVKGVRLVDFSGVETLPRATPYALTFLRPLTGVQTLSGVVPTEAARAALLDALEVDRVNSDVTLSLASGVPDQDWVEVAIRLIAATGDMNWAAVTVSDRAITVQGLVATPGGRVQLDDVVADLPEGYTASTQIDVADDGSPLRLNLSLSDSQVKGTGRFPPTLPTITVTDLFDVGEELTITQATVPIGDASWPDVARTAMQALAVLTEAQLTIEELNLTLTGKGTPDGKAEAERLLATIPANYDVTAEIGLWDDGTPLQITVDWSGEIATARGKLPAQFSIDPITDMVVVLETRQSYLADPDGAFSRNVQAGIAALGVLDTGQMSATDTTLTLTGTATSPRVNDAMDSALAEVSGSATITRDITYVDDGSPAAWTLTYTATKGAAVEGRLPVGMTVQDLSDTLGIPVRGAPAVAAEDAEADVGLNALNTVAEFLPEFESLTYTLEGGASALTIIVAPGVDLDLVAVDLAERLPPDLAFSLGPLLDLPSEGATRRNAVTGLEEVFTRGYWLPSLDFTADVAGCTAQSDAVLETAEITFLSGSDRLDATSIRAINALAAVARPCIDADLTLEIGGHTDATGSSEANAILSSERATAVLNALTSRGLPASAMFATGYGQSQPIADNATPEGRAANRRTSLSWLDPQTP